MQTRIFPIVTALLLTIALVMTYPTERMLAGNQGSGSTTCPSSGNKALTNTQTKVSVLTVQSAFGNAGTIYLGGSTVSSTSGLQLLVGDSYTFQTQGNSQPYDLSKTYFACSNSADTVVFTYTQ
jgi:hypothetical protein